MPRKVLGKLTDDNVQTVVGRILTKYLPAAGQQATGIGAIVRGESKALVVTDTFPAHGHIVAIAASKHQRDPDVRVDRPDDFFRLLVAERIAGTIRFGAESGGVSLAVIHAWSEDVWSLGLEMQAAKSGCPEPSSELSRLLFGDESDRVCRVLVSRVGLLETLHTGWSVRFLGRGPLSANRTFADPETVFAFLRDHLLPVLRRLEDHELWVAPLIRVRTLPSILSILARRKHLYYSYNSGLRALWNGPPDFALERARSIATSFARSDWLALRWEGFGWSRNRGLVGSLVVRSDEGQWRVEAWTETTQELRTAQDQLRPLFAAHYG